MRMGDVVVFRKKKKGKWDVFLAKMCYNLMDNLKLSVGFYLLNAVYTINCWIMNAIAG